MPKTIRLNAFEMACPVHLAPGMWTLPEDSSLAYSRLGYWTNLAARLEAGLFDGLFLADVVGIYDTYGGGADAALRSGAQVPLIDPVLLIPSMAAVTQNLGFGVTSILSYEVPYSFARRMSTLDHLTDGRIAWNIVTGYLGSAARAHGATGPRSHDTRYEAADEFMQIVYDLWERSWEDGALLRDRQAGIYSDPAKVHAIRHDGKHYRSEAIHLVEPSPQRTPVLYQAGSSFRGQAFAARHAECIYVSGPTAAVIAPRVAEILRHVAAAGRRRDDVLIFSEMTVIVDRTEAAARAKHARYVEHSRREGVLVLLSGWLGVDLARLAPDEPIRFAENDAIRSALQNVTTAEPDKVWTVGDVVDFATIGSLGPLVIGDPEQVADALQAWVEATDVDGFNLGSVARPDSFDDFITLVVPELQRRGVYKRAYAEGTYREKLFGEGRRRLGPGHPGSQTRSA